MRQDWISFLNFSAFSCFVFGWSQPSQEAFALFKPSQRKAIRSSFPKMILGMVNKSESPKLYFLPDEKAFDWFIVPNWDKREKMMKRHETRPDKKGFLLESLRST